MAAPVPYRDVQHDANDNDRRQESRASQQEPVVRQHLYVRIGHNLSASRGCGSRLGIAGARRIAIFEIFQAPKRTSFGMLRGGCPNLKAVLKQR